MERCSVCGFMLAVSPACCIADHITSKKNITEFDRLQESKENG